MKAKHNEMILQRARLNDILTQRYKRTYDPIELMVKAWIGLFLIASFLGAILIFALLITHPLSLMILCLFLTFIISISAIVRLWT
jgi:hypothetical protein